MDIINDCSAEIKKSLDLLTNQLFTLKYNFNTSELIPYIGKGSEKQSTAWDRLGREFKKVPSPVLYWFDVLSEINHLKIYQQIKDFRDHQEPDDKFRAVPALKPISKIKESRILYVGCCGTTTFINRMFWHFGYYRVGRTQGLQLCHWSQPLKLEIEINVMVFPQQAKHLIYVYEKYMAEKLKPLIGKHKG